jgi:glycine dehydrogenase subunit 2
MTINQSGWRPTAPEASEVSEGGAPATFTGNRALMLEEPLLFEIGDTQTTGVEFVDFSSPA